MLHHLTALAEKSVNSQGQEVWDLTERSRTCLAFVSWGIWLVTVVASLIFAINWVASGKTDVALCEYLEFIGNFWSGKPIYALNGLQGFHYLPIMLVIGTPLGWVSTPLGRRDLRLLSIAFLPGAFIGWPRRCRPRIPSPRRARSWRQAWSPRTSRWCCSRCRCR